jgi:hypothetical protein
MLLRRNYDRPRRVFGVPFGFAQGRLSEPGVDGNGICETVSKWGFFVNRAV